MKKSVKALLLVMCAIVLVVATVFTTLAYMTSQTKTITNTFTVGNVSITMDEAKTDQYGKEEEGADRLDGSDGKLGNEYKLIPGRTYTKDPTIHFANGEDAYLFVKVENEISGIEDGTTIAEQMTTNHWVQIGDTNYFYYDENADEVKGSVVKYAQGGDNDYEVFGNFTLQNADLTGYAGKKILITAYAVQADGFDDALDAFDNAYGELKISDYTPAA